MKNLTVQVPGAGGDGQLKNITIEPGTTPADITRNLGLQGFMLSKFDPAGKAKPFNDQENLYPILQEGDKLVAVSKAIVG